LRERNEDIGLLLEYFIGKYCTRFGLERKVLAHEARCALISYPWPGNVRELDNVIQKAVLLSSGKRIEETDLELGGKLSGAQGAESLPNMPTIRAARENAEKKAIRSALRATTGNVSQASRILDIDRKWLITKMSEYGISADDYRKNNSSENESRPSNS
jgi:DNA-binding NtrC family response regulator